MAPRRSAQALGADSLYCCKDGWYVEDVDSGDQLHLTSNALSLSAMRQAADIGRYGSRPRPVSVPLPVQDLVRRLSATPGQTEGSQEPWPRLSDYGADFGQFLEHFDSTCQTGDAPLHTVAARARLYALGKCLEGSLLDSYKGHLLRADQQGTLHHSPELVYSDIITRIKSKVLGHKGSRRQRAPRPRGSKGSSQRWAQVCRELASLGRCSQGADCPFLHDPDAVRLARRQKQQRNQSKKGIGSPARSLDPGTTTG